MYIIESYIQIYVVFHCSIPAIFFNATRSLVLGIAKNPRLSKGGKDPTSRIHRFFVPKKVCYWFVKKVMQLYSYREQIFQLKDVDGVWCVTQNLAESPVATGVRNTVKNKRFTVLNWCLPDDLSSRHRFGGLKKSELWSQIKHQTWGIFGPISLSKPSNSPTFWV